MTDDSRSRSAVEILIISIFVFCGAVFVILAMMLVGGAIAQQIHAPVTDKSLARSVAVEAGSAFVKSDFNLCDELESDVWTCAVSDKGGSGEYEYRVEVEPGTSCWKAVLTDDGGETPADKKLSSCVNRFEGGWWTLALG